MLHQLLWICLTFSLWLVLGREEVRLHQRGLRKAWLTLSAFRGGLLGLALALFMASLMTQAAGKIGQTPYFYDIFALSLSMIGVTFGVLVGFLTRLRAP